jgi:hypothetical protein
MVEIPLASRRVRKLTLLYAKAAKVRKDTLFLSCQGVVHPAALATSEELPIEQNGAGATSRFALARCHRTTPFHQISAKR